MFQELIKVETDLKIFFSRFFLSSASETLYYDYDNNKDDAGADDDGDDVGNKKHNKYQQQPQTERKPSPMLNTMRERRAANIFNENYVTDAQNNGK